MRHSGISPRAAANINAWIEDGVRGAALSVIVVLWQSLPETLEMHTPREIEVRITVRELAEKTGYSRARVKTAISQLHHDHGAVIRDRSLRNRRAWCIVLCDAPGVRSVDALAVRPVA